MLPYDITRCISPSCPKRWRCACYLDISHTDRRTSWADLTPEKGRECQDFIEWREDLDRKVEGVLTMSCLGDKEPKTPPDRGNSIRGSRLDPA